MHTGLSDPIIRGAIESAGLSAILVETTWIVGKRVEGKLNTFCDQQPNTRLGDEEYSYLKGNPKKPTISFEVKEILAIASDLTVALNEALRILQSEGKNPWFTVVE